MSPKSLRSKKVIILLRIDNLARAAVPSTMTWRAMTLKLGQAETGCLLRSLSPKKTRERSSKMRRTIL